MSSISKIGSIAVVGVSLTSPVMSDTRPMPDYFVSALVATSAAQALALSCSELSVDPVAVVQASEVLLKKLEADGFDPNDPAAQMESGEGRLTEAQAAFMDKHKLEGASGEIVCAAGRLEMSEGTEIGTLLVEVSE